MTSWCALGPASSATAQTTAGPAEQLARRYAPLVAVQHHPEPCGAGEPYLPVPVEAVLGQSDVVLRDAEGGVVVAGPVAADLFAAAPDAHLDLPGDALQPGCDYEERFAAAGAGARPTVYSRVATDTEHPGRIALQYWLFWVYNDWNDKHEGDWEMLQLVFEAASVEEALLAVPTEVAVAQHEGAERRPWVDVGRQAGRPVVFAATGSHAAYYSADRWFGKSAASGFGCDDTRSPTVLVDPAVVALPEVVTGADDPFAWLAFEGHWGEHQPAFNDGPTGPITKPQWAHPIVWLEEEGRTGSVSLPPLGTAVTDFFCTVSERGSLLFIDLLDEPVRVLLGLLAVVVLLAVGVRSTRWSPAEPLPIAMERRNGQLWRASGRFLRFHWRRFLPVSAAVIAGGLLASVLQRLLLLLPSVAVGADVVDRASAWGAVFALLAGGLVTVPVAILAVVACTVVAREIESHEVESHKVEGHEIEGQEIETAPHRRPSLLSQVVGSRAVAPTALLALLVLLSGLILPVTIYLLARWCVAPSVAIGGGAAIGRGAGDGGALRGSAALTRGRRWPIAVLVVVTMDAAALTGPFVGTLALLVSDASFAFVNVVSAVVGAVLLPWAALVLTLLHGDLTARRLSAAPRARGTP